MPETLLSPSSINIYGIELADLKLDPGKYDPSWSPPPPPPGQPASPPPPPVLGSNTFLRNQLKHSVDEPATLARIYAFSYEGYFYTLARPAIFVVHGKGREADENLRRPGPPTAHRSRAARAPGPVDDTGVAAQGYTFADDLRVWTYDKDDFSLRLDAESGPLARILLDAELGAPDALAQSSGMMARSSGMMARSSGMMARSSGMMARRGRGGDGLD